MAKVRDWGLTKSITFTEGEGAPHPGLAQGPAKGKTGPGEGERDIFLLM